MSKNSTGRLTESTYMILLASKEPIHGYGIIQRVKEMSQGKIIIGPGTLYGVLKKMIASDYIGLWEDSGQKIYQITELGIQRVLEELEQIRILLQLGLEVFDEV